MNYDPRRHHRRSIRLKGYDYTQAGAYFVTIVTQDRAHLFGEVVNGDMRLNAFGVTVREEWFKTAALRPYVRLFDDEFVVMPNHVHGIIWIVDDGDDNVATRRVAPTNDIAPTNGIAPTATATPRGPVSGSIGAIIGQFKSAAARRINALRGTPGASVWQRNYYEHIIRNEDALNRIRQYIADNPRRWELDPENPAAQHPEPEDPWRT